MVTIGPFGESTHAKYWLQNPEQVIRSREQNHSYFHLNLSRHLKDAVNPQPSNPDALTIDYSLSDNLLNTPDSEGLLTTELPLRNGCTYKDAIMIMNFYKNLLVDVGKTLFTMRFYPRADKAHDHNGVFTALFFYSRFYQKYSPLQYPPHFIYPTCLWIASKVEDAELPLEWLANNSKYISNEEIILQNKNMEIPIRKGKYDPLIQKQLLSAIKDLEPIVMDAITYSLCVFTPFIAIREYCNILSNPDEDSLLNAYTPLMSQLLSRKLDWLNIPENREKVRKAIDTVVRARAIDLCKIILKTDVLLSASPQQIALVCVIESLAASFKLRNSRIDTYSNFIAFVVRRKTDVDDRDRASAASISKLHRFYSSLEGMGEEIAFPAPLAELDSMRFVKSEDIMRISLKIQEYQTFVDLLPQEVTGDLIKEPAKDERKITELFTIHSPAPGIVRQPNKDLDPETKMRRNNMEIGDLMNK